MPPDSMADSWAGVMRSAHHLDDLQVLRLGFLRFQVFQLFLLFRDLLAGLAISWSMRSILFLAIVKSLLFFIKICHQFIKP